ncbi:MAG: sugar isomerase [Blautia sp.]|nr:sugar isomerase [Blautia sp.]
MSDVTKKKKFALNMVTSFGSQVITICLGFIIPRLILTNFGSEVNGVLTSINQIFSYFYLLEAGVGIASLQAMYQPLAKEEHDSANRILTATNKYYHRTGMIYAGLLFVFAFVYAWYAKSSLSFWTIFFLVLTIGTPVAFSYLVQGAYRIFLEADGKVYVVSTITTVTQITSNVMKIAAIFLTHNIILVQAAFYLAPMIQPLVLVFYVKKKYKWCNAKHPDPDYKSISQKSSALVHQISGVIFANSDVLLLTFMTNYLVISVYATYNLIYDYAGRLLDSVCNSNVFGLAHMFHTDKTKFRRVFEYYETAYIMILFMYFTMIFLFTAPFIKLYTAGVTDVTYTDALLPMLFVLIRLLSNGKVPIQNVINFSEHFQQTKSHAILEMTVNLAASIVGIKLCGIYGCLLGTIAALLVRNSLAITYANRRLLSRSVWSTLKKWIVNFAAFLLIYRFLGSRIMEYGSYLELILRCIPYGIAVVLIYLLVNVCTQLQDFKNLYQDLGDWGLLKKLHR